MNTHMSDGEAYTSETLDANGSILKKSTELRDRIEDQYQSRMSDVHSKDSIIEYRPSQWLQHTWNTIEHSIAAAKFSNNGHDSHGSGSGSGSDSGSGKNQQHVVEDGFAYLDKYSHARQIGTSAAPAEASSSSSSIRKPSMDEKHLLVTSDCSYAADWQALLLLHSLQRSGHVGGITRLIRGCDAKAKFELQYYYTQHGTESGVRSHLYFVPTEACADNWKMNNARNGGTYIDPCSVAHFLLYLSSPSAQTNSNGNDDWGEISDGTVLILIAADMLAIRPVPSFTSYPRAESATIMDSRKRALMQKIANIILFSDHSGVDSVRHWDNTHYTLMSPYMITKRDLSKIVVEWQSLYVTLASNNNYRELLLMLMDSLSRADVDQVEKGVVRPGSTALNLLELYSSFAYMASAERKSLRHDEYRGGHLVLPRLRKQFRTPKEGSGAGGGATIGGAGLTPDEASVMGAKEQVDRANDVVWAPIDALGGRVCRVPDKRGYFFPGAELGASFIRYDQPYRLSSYRKRDNYGDGVVSNERNTTMTTGTENAAYHFYKKKISRDVFSCQYPLYAEPPNVDLVLTPSTRRGGSKGAKGRGQRGNRKLKEGYREAFVLCTVLRSFNSAVSDIKRQVCPKNSNTERNMMMKPKKASGSG
jgi:hypothetical protein